MADSRWLYESVDRRASVRADDDRVDVDGADEVSKVHRERGESRQGPGQGGYVRRWRAPDPVEQRTGGEPVDEPRGPHFVQGRQGETPVVERLDQYSAGGDHDQRTELRIVHHPERHLDAWFHHLLYRDGGAES